MIVVVATTEGDLARVQTRLSSAGLDAVRVRSPGGERRLVLADVADERDAERLAVTLRAEGEMAVARADAGVRRDAWMRHTLPVDFGERLTVCFAWSEHDRRGRTGVIELGPDGFGNGGHPTTRMIVEELTTRITGGERVLDLGCGSGVLGLCAVELGADRVVAVDLKPAAVAATRRNAALNGMHDRVEATTVPLDQIDGVFDIVVANVGRAALVELAPALVGLVAPGGWLTASGIPPSLCDLVAGFLRPLVEIDRRHDGDWAVLTLAG